MIRTLAIWILVTTQAGLSLRSMAQDSVSFPEQVAPVLQEHCIACHCAKRAEGGYRIDTIEQLIKPGDSASSPLVPGKRDQSEWILRMKHTDASLRMPLDSEPISNETIEMIAKWIDQGAKLDGLATTDPLWSIIPPSTYPAPPEHYALSLPVTALSFSVDGSQLYSSGFHELIAWNPNEGSIVARFGNLPQRIYAIAQAADPSKLFVGGGTPGTLGEVRLLNRTNNSIEKVLVRGQDVVLDLAVRPGNQELAVALADNTIRIINLENFQQRRVIASHADWVTQIAYSDDGKRLGSSSRDKSAKVADADSGELLGSYPGHAAAVRGIVAVQDGLQWVSVGADNKIHRWEVENAKKIAEVGLGGEGTKIIKNNSSIWIPNSDKHWYRLELANNAIGAKQAGHEDWITSIAIHSGTGKVATGSMDGAIRVWNLSDGTLIKAWLAKP